MFTKALFIDFKEEDIEKKYLNRIKKLFDSIEFVAGDDPSKLEKLQDVEAVFVKIFTKVDKELIDAAPNLKYIGVLSTAFDEIDANYARSKNIPVCNLGGYSTEAVAEFFFAVLLNYVRELEQAKQQAQQEDYSFDKFMTIELKNKVLGVVGAGRIGSRIAEIGIGFGMKVIYFSRKNKPEIEKLGAEKRNLDEVLTKSDVISLNLALNKETKGIIGKEKIGLLKKGCVFICLAPPDLVDQKAIMAKAKKGDITYIFDQSDYLDPSLVKKFLETKNCLVYPPVAFRTKGANTRRWETFALNIEQFAKGNPQNVVN